MVPLRSIAVFVAVLALTVQTVMARVDVRIDFDKTFKFAAVRTWGWNPKGTGDVKMARTKDDDPDAMKKRAESPIVDAVGRDERPRPVPGAVQS